MIPITIATAIAMTAAITPLLYFLKYCQHHGTIT